MTSEILELELQAILSHHVGVENRSQILLKNSHCIRGVSRGVSPAHSIFFFFKDFPVPSLPYSELQGSSVFFSAAFQRIPCVFATKFSKYHSPHMSPSEGIKVTHTSSPRTAQVRITLYLLDTIPYRLLSLAFLLFIDTQGLILQFRIIRGSLHSICLTAIPLPQLSRAKTSGVN